jgi:hypothetical protein
MRNILFTLVLSVFSISALAATPLTMAVNPNKPIVLTSDAVIDPGGANELHLTGPWFSVRFVAYNGGNDPVTLTGFKVTVTSSDGTMKTTHINADGNATINMGEKFTQMMYMDALPKTDKYVYQVLIEVEGYLGDKDNKSGDLDPSQFKFITQ